MANTVIYGVVIKTNNGGENMDSFSKKESALNRSKEIIDLILESGRKGFKVYLSELEYDSYKNVILSNSLIDNESDLLFQN